MEHPLSNVRVAVANGPLRSEGKDLIAGETVKAFFTWPKHIQDIAVKNRTVVILSPKEAEQAAARAAEIRARIAVKEEDAEVRGIEAQIKGIDDMLSNLDKQRDELIAKAVELHDQLKEKQERVAAKRADPNLRPEDSETDAVEHVYESSLDEAAGIKQPKEPDEDTASVKVATANAPLIDPADLAQIEQWANGLPYRELQGEAAKLNINGVGVRHAELVEAVINAVAAKEAEKQTGAAE